MQTNDPHYSYADRQPERAGGDAGNSCQIHSFEVVPVQAKAACALTTENHNHNLGRSEPLL